MPDKLTLTIAAIYARKSNDEGQAATEDRSVTRQIEHGKAFAAEKGWTVPDDQVYCDDGVSGAEFAARPGFVRLMNALKPAPPFRYLVMSEESRLGREQIETSYALKQLVQAGVEVWFYMERRQRTLDTPTDKIMAALTGFADELEREKARARTKDALARKARNGFVTGGRTFGYDNVEILGPDGERSHVERRINEAEAAVVRRIFELTAQGLGKYRLAMRLNEEGHPSPRPQQGRPAGWAPSSIGAVLHRDLYRGVVVWNKSKKRDSWGQINQRARPESEWMAVPAPDLRIVSDELWEAAHDRLAKTRANYLRGTGGRLWGRPVNGQEGRYLLTGLARCGHCGGGLEMRSRSNGKGKKRTYFYSCSSHYRKGKSVCPNRFEIPMPAADQAVLGTLLDEILTPERLAQVAERAVSQAQADREAAPDLRERIERQLADAEAALERLAAAVAAGGDLPVLVAGIKAKEAERRRLAGRLEALATPPPAVGADLEQRLRGAVEEWREVLGQRVPVARQIVAKLLDDRLVFQPETRKGRRGFRFRATGTVEKLVQGAVPGFLAGASPTGFEPVLPA